MDRWNTILIVDDRSVNRRMLEEILADESYHLITTTSGMEALEKASQTTPDLILLDVSMPRMDGYETCRQLRNQPELSDIPILLLTAHNDTPSHTLGFEAGADGIITRPFQRDEIRMRVRSIFQLNRFRRMLHEREKFNKIIELSPDGILLVTGKGVIRLANSSMAKMLGLESENALLDTPFQQWIAPDHKEECDLCFNDVIDGDNLISRHETIFSRADGSWLPVEVSAGSLLWENEMLAEMVVRDITERKIAEGQISTLLTQLTEAYEATLDGWTRALDLRDHETEGHTRRVTQITIQLAEHLGISGETTRDLRNGAILHDIGKMGVPDAILLKPGPLNRKEWKVMRQHPVYAYQMLQSVKYFQASMDVPYCHHEKWDGTGYPRRLRGELIPLSARIFSLADVWDAMRSDRPYRKSLSRDEVFRYIRSEVGTRFDPVIAHEFMEMYARGELP